MRDRPMRPDPSGPAALLAAGLIVVLGVPAAAEDIPPGQFLETYRAAIKRQVADQGRYTIAGDLRLTMDRQDGQPPFRDETRHLFAAADGRDRLFGYAIDKPNYLERRFVLRGAGASFGMRRSSAGAAYGLEHLDKIPSGLLADRALVAEAARAIGDDSLAPLVDSPQFSISRASRQAVDGRDVVRVEFAHRPTDRVGTYDMVGTMDLDPANDHAILAYAVRRQLPGLPEKDRVVLDLTGTVAYSRQDGCRLLPETLMHRDLGSVLGKPRLNTVQEYHSTRVTPESVAAREFTPEFYGLGALDRPRGRTSSGAAYWAFGVAVIALGVAFVLRRLGRSPGPARGTT